MAKQRTSPTLEIGAALFGLLLFVIAGCKSEEIEVSLASFETSERLQGPVWECKRWFSLVNSHTTHGDSALKAELGPSSQPFLIVFPVENNWTSYQWFQVDIYNDTAVALPLTIRFIDKESDEDPTKFYSKIWNLLPGHNGIKISIIEIQSGPKNRNLKLHRIEKVSFFLGGLQNRCMLYLDNMRLSK